MNLELYHYIHCPFCIRVRMALSMLGLEYKSNVLQYNDEETPVKLCGVKMLPILKRQDGGFMNESIDIIRYIDLDQKLFKNIQNDDIQSTENFLNQIGQNIHNLCMPFWANTLEFSKESRNYFIEKKEKKRGPFSELYLNRSRYTQDIQKSFKDFEVYLKPFFKSDSFSILDLMVASHLWGLFLVPEFRFPQKVYDYLIKVRDLTKFDYHIDYWNQDGWS